MQRGGEIRGKKAQVKKKRCLEQKNSGKHRKEKLDEVNQGSDNTTA